MGFVSESKYNSKQSPFLSPSRCILQSYLIRPHAHPWPKTPAGQAAQQPITPARAACELRMRCAPALCGSMIARCKLQNILRECPLTSRPKAGSCDSRPAAHVSAVRPGPRLTRDPGRTDFCGQLETKPRLTPSRRTRPGREKPEARTDSVRVTGSSRPSGSGWAGSSTDDSAY